MKKIRPIWVLAVVIVILAAAAIGVVLSRSSLSVGNLGSEQLPQGQPITGSAGPQAASVQIGDAFLYTIDVWYNPAEVSEIDRTSLDDNVNLSPFNVRSIKETESNVASGIRLYQRQYQIQLLSGDINQDYTFPTIVVRYKLRATNGFADISITPSSVFVASRFPGDISDIASSLEQGNDLLRPLVGQVEDTSRTHLAWIFWALGGLLAVVAVVDLRMRVIPKWQKQRDEARGTKASRLLGEAYRSLCCNYAQGASPRSLLHQMDHILRMVLAQKANIAWLEEPNPDSLPSEIKPSVVALMEKHQKACRAQDLGPEEAQEALRQLENILRFYFGREMETWQA